MAATVPATGAQDHRFVVGALLALGAATGIVFGRVFQGRPASLRLIAAGILAIVLAEVLRRRSILLSVTVSAAGLLVFLGLAVFPDTLWWGLPTMETVRALGAAVRALGPQAAQEIAPAPSLPSLMTASVTAVWAASAAAHALAVRSRSTILPVLPPAALLAFAGVVTGDGPRLVHAAILLLAAAAVLLGVAAERLGLWGRVVQRTAGHRRRLLGGSTLRSAGWVALAALLAALMIPGALPGYGARPFVDLQGNEGPVAISPIVDIRPSLRQTPAARLFTVQAEHPAYWRMVALDRFDGLVWTASDLYAENGATIDRSATLVPSPAPGQLLTQVIRIDDLATSWLPAAFEPQDVEVEGELRYSARNGVLVRPEGVNEGFTYEVTSKLVTPTAAELNEVRLPTGASLEPYLQLPPELPAAIRAETRRIVQEAGAMTPYQQAVAIQEHLRTFRYDAAIPPGHANRDLVEFLFRTQRGYCEQFAGAMAVMLRTLGIPSRVAVGFRPGLEAADGTFLVSSRDAHAWPEVFFDRLGWLPFEPTPSRNNPVGDYLRSGGVAPSADDGGGDDPAAQGNSRQGRGQQTRGEALEPAPPGRAALEVLTGRRGPGPEPAFPWGPVVLGLLGTALIVMAYAAVAKSVARRLGLRGARRAAAQRAYRVVAATAADLGFPRRHAETLTEYRNRLRGSVAFSDGHLDRLSDLTALSLYAPRDLTDREGQEALAAARQVGRDLRRHAGFWRSALGAIRPTPPY